MNFHYKIGCIGTKYVSLSSEHVCFCAVTTRPVAAAFCLPCRPQLVHTLSLYIFLLLASLQSHFSHFRLIFYVPCVPYFSDFLIDNQPFMYTTATAIALYYSHHCLSHVIAIRLRISDNQQSSVRFYRFVPLKN